MTNKSQIGFGTYRIDHITPEHYQALYKAIENGIRVIDTSSNYTDGESEKVVGNVITDLISEGKIKREDITIITKGGYIQGQNYKLAQKRKESGKPYSDVVEYSPGLWHCISPDFLDEQMSFQFERLNQSKGRGYIDVYLLHNPEYYMGWAFNLKDKPSGEEIRNIFYARIKKAFEFLEELSIKNIIRSYGISSNTFPAGQNKYDFVSLEKIISIAESISSSHHFKYIQFPFNLIESGALFEKNQKGSSKTVIELAKKYKLSTIINRPLNAITNQGLIRLAEFEIKEIPEEDTEKLLTVCSLVEEDLKDGMLQNLNLEEKTLVSLTSILDLAQKLKENFSNFGSIEHLKDIIENYFVPRIDYLLKMFTEVIKDKEVSEKGIKYLEDIMKLLILTSNHYKRIANKRSGFISRIINENIDTKYFNLSLAQKAINIIGSIKGVDIVLVGARKETYVKEILSLQNTHAFANPEKILLRLKEELAKENFRTAEL